MSPFSLRHKKLLFYSTEDRRKMIIKENFRMWNVDLRKGVYE